MATPPSKRITEAVVRRLADLRQRQGLTQQQLAERTGVHRTYIGLLERGKRQPTLDVTIRLAHALGQHLSQLLTDAERSTRVTRERGD